LCFVIPSNHVPKTYVNRCSQTTEARTMCPMSPRFWLPYFPHHFHFFACYPSAI
jgi:hypothetical protein